MTRCRASGRHQLRPLTIPWPETGLDVAVGRSSVQATNGPEDEHIAAVLRAAGRGERWALAKLYRAYQPMLVRYLRGRAPAVADDLAAEVWLDVARHLERFVGDERGFRAWLFTIARARMAGHRRQRVRRRTDPVPPDELDQPSRASWAADPALLVVDRMSASQALDRLTSRLSSDQAEVVLLRVVAGFDVAEVAQIMERTPGAVRVLCHRALRHLAASFAAEVRAE